MKRIILSTAAAVALGALGFGTASAQYAPTGSYQQSCTNIRVRGDVLRASCNGPRSGTVRSSISIASCRRGDIANMNGQLTCNNNGNNGYGRGNYGRGGYGNNGNNGNNGYGNNGNSGYGNNGALPPGSYQSSCSNTYVRGAVLTANCPSGNGTRYTSTIGVRDCRGADIANINGRLQCH